MPLEYPLGPPEDEESLRQLFLWELARLTRSGRPVGLGAFFRQMGLPGETFSRCINVLHEDELVQNTTSGLRLTSKGLRVAEGHEA